MYLDNIAQEKVFCNILVNASGDSIALVKTLSNVALEAQDNPKEKILLNLILIPQGQHCARKKLLLCCLNTPWTTLHRLKPCEILSLRLQTTLHKKDFVYCCLNTLGTTLHRSQSHAILSGRLQTTQYRKKILRQLHRKNPQYCSRGSRQHCKRKNPVQCRLNLIWSLFNDFHFRPLKFLIISGCCKCHASIVQIQPTLCKRNLRPILNKKTRLYETLILYMQVEFD